MVPGALLPPVAGPVWQAGLLPTSPTHCGSDAGEQGSGLTLGHLSQRWELPPRPSESTKPADNDHVQPKTYSSVLRISKAWHTPSGGHEGRGEALRHAGTQLPTHLQIQAGFAGPGPPPEAFFKVAPLSRPGRHGLLLCPPATLSPRFLVSGDQGPSTAVSQPALSHRPQGLPTSPGTRLLWVCTQCHS